MTAFYRHGETVFMFETKSWRMSIRSLHGSHAMYSREAWFLFRPFGAPYAVHFW